MCYRSPYRSMLNGVSSAIILLGLVLAFAFGGFNLVVFFSAMGVAMLVGSFNSSSPKGPVGRLMAALWMFIMALFFLTDSWLWFLVGGALSFLFGSLSGPLSALFLGIGVSIFGWAAQPKQPTYEAPPMQQPYQPEPYRNGYTQSESYSEGRQHTYPAQQSPLNTYDEPEAKYQQLPEQQ